MYTAIAGQWFEEKGAYWVERDHKAWQKVSAVMETGKYPSWQKEPWLQHGFPMDAVREFLRVCIVDLQCVSVSRSGGVLPLQSADLSGAIPRIHWLLQLQIHWSCSRSLSRTHATNQPRIQRIPSTAATAVSSWAPSRLLPTGFTGAVHISPRDRN